MGGGGIIRLLGRCERIGWEMAYGAYLLEAFSPGIGKYLPYAGFLSRKTLVCVTLFSTPGLSASMEEFFYFIYFLSIFLNILSILFSLAPTYRILEELLPSYPEGLCPSAFSL